MKYCSKCGKELVDEAIICTGCGCAVDGLAAGGNAAVATAPMKKESGITTATKVMMILGTILTGLCGYLIPLAWCIPMTVSYFKKVKNGMPIGTGFKVCSLLFVSLVGGILMLCDKDY